MIDPERKSPPSIEAGVSFAETTSAAAAVIHGGHAKQGLDTAAERNVQMGKTRKKAIRGQKEKVLAKALEQ